MSSQDIQLLVVLPEHREAFHRGKQHLAALISANVPDGWPMFPEAFDLPSTKSHTACTDWPSYLFIWRSLSTLVGNGGFVAPPNSEGEVEIGYEIAPAFRLCGFATKAVKAMVEIAFGRTEVKVVVAHTLAEVNASNAVLKKVGMSFVREVPNAEVGVTWRWELRR